MGSYSSPPSLQADASLASGPLSREVLESDKAGNLDTRELWIKVDLKTESMAWNFELSVECDHNHEAALAVSRHFETHIFTLDDGRSVQCRGGVGEDDDKRWWAEVVPLVDGKALVFNNDPELLNSVGTLLYEHLKSAPSFRFAILGIETYQFNRFEAFPSLLQDTKSRAGLNGLVVNDTVLEILGPSLDFIPFTRGYSWLPTEGGYV